MRAEEARILAREARIEYVLARVLKEIRYEAIHGEFEMEIDSIRNTPELYKALTKLGYLVNIGGAPGSGGLVSWDGEDYDTVMELTRKNELDETKAT